MTTPQHPLRDPEHRVGKRRLLAVSVSVAVHLLVALALVPVVTGIREPQPSPPVLVTLTPPEPARSPDPAPTPGEDPGDSAPADKTVEPKPEKAPVKAAPRPSPAPPQSRVTRAPVRPPPNVPTVVAASAAASTVGQIALLGDAQLAGALTAGSGRGSGQGAGSGSGSGAGNGPGSSGGTCDMVERLETVLRRDSRILATATQAHSTISGAHQDRGALLVWDGDWLRNPGQEGKGLAGLRQAIAVEVAFAPAACRAQSVNGLVLIRLGDAPGDPRIALGAGRWRWSDLLGL